MSAQEPRHTPEPRYTRREVLDVLPADGEALVPFSPTPGWRGSLPSDGPATSCSRSRPRSAISPRSSNAASAPAGKGETLTAVTAVLEDW